MYQAMEVNAFAHVENDTDITFLTARNGVTEFSFDKHTLVLSATEGGLGKLAEVVSAAVADRREKRALAERGAEG